MNKKNSLRKILFLLLLLGVTGVSAVSFSAPFYRSALRAEAAAITAPASTSGTIGEPIISKNNTLSAIEKTLEDIYNQVNPSVVSIVVTQKAETPDFSQFPGLPFPFPFEFGPQTPPGQQPQEPQEFYRHGAGSGFVWDKAGHIITNNHVVDGADKISVKFADGEVAKAQVVGNDPDSDLAVLKVDVPAARLQPVEIGNSTQVKVGQLAAAIGNPFGLENTMTVGFVSALGRILPVSAGTGQSFFSQGPSYTIPDIIQTDAPINPGNSGGVLVNDQGQVIGVTAAIESPVRASAGIGFAIPSAVVEKVVPALIQNGSYDHPWLGLSGVSLNPELAQAMNLKADQHGTLIIDVTPDSPADQAGLRGSDRQVKIEDQQVRVGGDVIVAINGQPIKTFDDVVSYLNRATEVDQTITLTVLHQGKEETVKARLAARPKVQSQPTHSQNTVDHGVRLGIEGATVTPEIAKAMGLPANQTGVLVERIEISSPADQAHLNGSYKSATTVDGQSIPVGGDIITAVDGKSVASIEELQAIIRQAEPGQSVVLTVLRDGKQMEVPVTLGEPAS